MKTKLEKALERHKKLVEAVARSSEQVDKAYRSLKRANNRHDRNVKAVSRSSKRLDQLRAEERAAKKKPKVPKELNDTLVDI